jgi:hypothetical protein
MPATNAASKTLILFNNQSLASFGQKSHLSPWLCSAKSRVCRGGFVWPKVAFVAVALFGQKQSLGLAPHESGVALFCQKSAWLCFAKTDLAEHRGLTGVLLPAASIMRIIR